MCEKVPKGTACLLVTSIWSDVYVAAMLGALRKPAVRQSDRGSHPGGALQGWCRGTHCHQATQPFRGG